MTDDELTALEALRAKAKVEAATSPCGNVSLMTTPAGSDYACAMLEAAPALLSAARERDALQAELAALKIQASQIAVERDEARRERDEWKRAAEVCQDFRLSQHEAQRIQANQPPAQGRIIDDCKTRGYGK